MGIIFIRAKRPKRDLYRKFVPTRVSSVKEFRSFENKKPDEWTLQALFGLYVAMYEDRYKRRWPYTSATSQIVVNDLRLLVVREKEMATAIKAVRAIFTHSKLRWINSTHHDMLADRDKYFKHVFPYVFEEQQAKGEQSEWGGARGEAKSKVVSTKSFFGGGP